MASLEATVSSMQAQVQGMCESVDDQVAGMRDTRSSREIGRKRLMDQQELVEQFETAVVGVRNKVRLLDGLYHALEFVDVPCTGRAREERLQQYEYLGGKGKPLPISKG